MAAFGVKLKPTVTQAELTRGGSMLKWSLSTQKQKSMLASLLAKHLPVLCACCSTVPIQRRGTPERVVLGIIPIPERALPGLVRSMPV